ncbi:hypothetical protein ACFX2A_023876 [Malus domestica]
MQTSVVAVLGGCALWLCSIAVLDACAQWLCFLPVLSGGSGGASSSVSLPFSSAATTSSLELYPSQLFPRCSKAMLYLLSSALILSIH